MQELDWSIKSSESTRLHWRIRFQECLCNLKREQKSFRASVMIQRNSSTRSKNYTRVSRSSQKRSATLNVNSQQMQIIQEIDENTGNMKSTLSTLKLNSKNKKDNWISPKATCQIVTCQPCEEHITSSDFKQNQFSVPSLSNTLKSLSNRFHGICHRYSKLVHTRESSLKEWIKLIQDFSITPIQVQSPHQKIRETHWTGAEFNMILTEFLNYWSKYAVIFFSTNKMLLGGYFHYCVVRTVPGNLLSMSGGQQALCACALSLSFQRLFPSPIFFYDEIDSSLDTHNTSKWLSCLKSFDSQFICISLRPNMYEKQIHWSECIVREIHREFARERFRIIFIASAKTWRVERDVLVRRRRSYTRFFKCTCDSQEMIVDDNAVLILHSIRFIMHSIK